MKKAFTLAETVIVLAIIGLLVTVFLKVLKPAEMKEEALAKLAKATYHEIDVAVTAANVKNTNNYSFLSAVDEAGNFSIEEADNLDRFVELFKKQMKLSRKTVSNEYKTASLIRKNNTILSSVTIGDFSGFLLNNGVYFGLKLNDNCTTTIDYISDPSSPKKTSVDNTCGVIFFDINGEEKPNTIGMDQFFVGLGKSSLK